MRSWAGTLAALVGLGMLLALPAALVGTSPASPSVGEGLPTLPASPELPVAAGWSMYHGDPELNGVASSAAPAHPHLLWAVTLPIDATNPPGTGEHPYQSSPVVAGGYVLVTTGETLFILNGTTGQTVRAIDLEAVLGEGAYTATPTVTNAGDVLVAGGADEAALIDPTTGTSLVTCDVGNDLDGSFTPIPGYLVEGDAGGDINGVDLATDACATGTWNNVGGASYRATPSVAYVNGAWRFYLTDYAHDQIDDFAATGGGATTIPLTNSENDYGSLAVTNLTNASQSYPVGFVGDAPAAGNDAYLYAVNLSSGALFANAFEVPSGTNPHPVGTEGTMAVADEGQGTADIFVGNDTGNLSAYQFTASTGGWFQPLWSFQVPGSGTEFVGSPALAGGYVVDASTAGVVYGVNAATGTLAWNVTFAGERFLSSPAVQGGVVYVFSASGLLAALDTAATTVTLQPPSPTPSSGATAMVAVNVQGVDTEGAPGTGVGGASVSLDVPAGSVAGPDPATTDAAGWAYFNWTTPAGTSSDVNYTLEGVALASGYAAGYDNATVEVLGVPPSGGALEMSAVVTTGAPTLGLTASTSVTVSVAHPGGAPLPGAAVALSAVGGGSLAVGLGTTGSSGTFTTTYTAPATGTGEWAVLVLANVTLLGYRSTQNATAVEILGTTGGSLPGLAVTALPYGNLSVASGGTVPFELVVTSQGAGAVPLAGATATVTRTPQTLGTFLESGSASTAAGVLYFNFSALEGTGSVLGLFQITATGYAGGAAEVAVAVLPTGALSGSISLSGTVTSSGPHLSGSAVDLAVAASYIAADGGTSSAVGLLVDASVSPNGYDGLNASTLTLNGEGQGSLSLALPLFDRPTLMSVLLSASALGYGSTSSTVAFLVVPQPISLSTSLSSSTVTSGGTTTLEVQETSDGSDLGNAFANASLTSASSAELEFGSADAVTTSTSGVAHFTLVVTGAAGSDAVVEVEASLPGYAATTTNVTVTVVAASSGVSLSGGPTILGLPWLEFLLLLVIVILALGVVVASRRASHEPASPPGAPPPAAYAGAGFEEGLEPAASPGPAPSGPVPPSEYVEGPRPIAPAPPPVAPPEPAPEDDATPPGPSGPLAGPEEAVAPTGGSAPTGMHVELERTLGDERPSVEEANPYAEQNVQPEDVNPNVRRIPKPLLQPAEMRIQEDAAAPAPTEEVPPPPPDDAPGEVPPPPDEEHERRSQELLAKWRKLRMVDDEEPGAGPGEPPS